MCWNAVVSLNTFLFGAFACLFALMNGYPWAMLLVVVSFTLMQLVEYFLWTHLADRRLNKAFTIVAFVVLLCQPVAATMLLPDIRMRLVGVATYAVGIMAFLVSSLLLGPSKTDPASLRTTVGTNGHLAWSFLSRSKVNVPLVFWYMAFLFMPMVWSRSYLLLGVTALTLAISLYFAYRHDTWGTMWCWTSNVLMFLVVGKILFWDQVCK